MINLAYIAFFYILLVEIIIFLILALPTPIRLKARLVKQFMGSEIRSTLMWVHLALCVLAGLFFLDLAQTQINFAAQKERLREIGIGNVGTQVRLGFLSYQIQRVQRNKYITAMLIYVSIVLNMSVRMLNYIFKKRGDYDKILTSKQKMISPPASPATIPRDRTQPMDAAAK